MIAPGFAALGLARVELAPGGERVAALEVVRTAPSKRQVESGWTPPWSCCRDGGPPHDNARRVRELAVALAARIGPATVALCCEGQSWPRNASSAVKVALCGGVVYA